MRTKYDAIVVGSGIAGLTSAIYLHQAGCRVAVLTKEDSSDTTATNLAQGGIIAWQPDDSAESLKQDLMQAGCGVNNLRAVEQLASEGPRLVFDFLIEKVGMDFSQNASGQLDYTEEAAHAIRRILHYHDFTGDRIQHKLLEYARQIGLPILTGRTSVDLITNNHHSKDCQEVYRPREVMGLYVLNNQTRQVETFLADTVILATGGIGNLYQHTTNPAGSTGDGMSMAHRAGAEIINAEFIQFHPTALYHRDIKRFLISESLRGEGAILLNHAGDAFMERYTPQKELAPRDVVARAIYQEMARTGKEYMFLDASQHYIGKEPLPQRFSKIYNTCLQGGIDITKEPIPIVPAAHYFCGGIKVDLDGRTTLKNLYAIGETSCTGLHGANRLASSSLLEGLLWGKRAALAVIAADAHIAASRYDAIPDWQPPAHTERFDPLLFVQDWSIIQQTMWNYAGIIRTRKGLERARADINYHSHRIFKFYKQARLSKEIIELRNGIVNASIVVHAAQHNKRPVGCHFVAED
jgi:L-aspartate oxidase